MKTKRPLIGITAREMPNPIDKWAPKLYAQNHTYIDAVVQAGGIPVILPLTSNEAVRRALFDRCDGLLFSGGEDIDPKRFGQKPGPETTDISPTRDEHEWSLMEWALEDNKPILGICRGMQLLNVVCGGSLYLHVLHDVPGAQDHTESRLQQNGAYLAHTLTIDPASRLAHVLGYDTIRANTRHHQAVKELGEGLVATAWAEDKIIEALELPDKPFVVGIESHPEDLVGAVEPAWLELFHAFVDAAELYSQFEATLDVDPIIANEAIAEL